MLCVVVFRKAGEKEHLFDSDTLRVRTYEAVLHIHDLELATSVLQLVGQDFMQNAIGGVVTRAAKAPCFHARVSKTTRILKAALR